MPEGISNDLADGRNWPRWNHLGVIPASFLPTRSHCAARGHLPINNPIKTWTPESLPIDWKAQERRWDLYHWVRTCGMIVGFALLLVSLAVR
jgi:hypothetical protein